MRMVVFALLLVVSECAYAQGDQKTDRSEAVVASPETSETPFLATGLIQPGPDCGSAELNIKVDDGGVKFVIKHLKGPGTTNPGFIDPKRGAEFNVGGPGCAIKISVVPVRAGEDTRR